MLTETVETLLAKDLPPEQLQILQDPSCGLVAVIAVHDTRRGPAFGGIRRKAYPDLAAALEDVQRLAAHMTLKCAIQGVAGGGGKAVILDHPGLDRAAAYRRLGAYVEALGGRFYTGPDVGTTPEDLAEVAAATGFVTRPGADGPGDLAVPTAQGVFAGIRAVAQALGVADLSDLHVAVQGLGGVGGRLCSLLAAAGARLSVSDIDPARVQAAVEDHGAASVDNARIHELEADVFAPCALGGLVSAASVPVLGARAIAGSANNICVDARAGRDLAARGILYAPDFVINSGALVHGALYHLEGQVPPLARIEAIEGLLLRIFDRARAAEQTPEQVALQMAREVLLATPARPFFAETTR